jgi:hypothetical protein
MAFAESLYKQVARTWDSLVATALVADAGAAAGTHIGTVIVLFVWMEWGVAHRRSHSHTQVASG